MSEHVHCKDCGTHTGWMAIPVSILLSWSISTLFVVGRLEKRQKQQDARIEALENAAARARSEETSEQR